MYGLVPASPGYWAQGGDLGTYAEIEQGRQRVGWDGMNHPREDDDPNADSDDAKDVEPRRPR
jgi:hypothetical protein